MSKQRQSTVLSSVLVAFAIAAALAGSSATAGVVLLGHWDTEEPVFDLELVGDLAYLACGHDGLIVLDLIDPAAPVPVGDLITGDGVKGVAIVGDRLYLADGHLRVVDVSDPTDPTILGSVDLGVATSVVVRGTHAYVASSYMGLRIVDISDPTAPTMVGEYDAPSDLHAIHVSADDELVYVTHSDLGGFPVFVMDVSDPTAPERVSWFYTVQAQATAARNGFVYTADDPHFWVMDVSDPTDPAGVAMIPFSSRDIALSGSYAFLASWQSGFGVVDITDPTAPLLVGGYMIDQGCRAVAAEGDRILLSGVENDVWILQSDPSTPVEDLAQNVAWMRITAHPNPFNPTTTIHYELPRECRVTLAVFDLSGRLVDTLVDRVESAGFKSAAWRAEGNASGVYFCRLDAGEFSQVRKLTLVR